MEEFITFYDSLVELDRFGVSEDFDDFNRITDFYSKLSFAYTQFSIILAVLSPIVEYKSCLKRKNEYYKICGVVNTWAPFDITIFPYKQIIYLAAGYTYYALFSAILSITFFSAILSRYLIFRLSYVKVLLRKTDNEHDIKKKKQNLLHAIEYHFEILR